MTKQNPSISPARTAAFDVLLRIETDRALSSVVLASAEPELSAVDRSLCHELTLGVLRRQIFLDQVLFSLSSGKKLDPEVRIALRLGLYQVLFLDRIPVYSAINESVNLVARARKTSAKGFVNAILRRASRASTELVFRDKIERMSSETSHPRWLLEKWIRDHGIEAAAAIAMANNVQPPAAFRIFRHAPRVDELIRTSNTSNFVKGCFIAPQGTRLADLHAEGEIYLQDEGSQMVAAVVRLGETDSFLDVCAAPGGKTGLIALAHPDSLGVAGDLRPARVDYLKSNLKNQGVTNVRVVQYDAERPLPFADGTFNAVLVDAPCSGTGTIRANPEIRYFLAPDDFASLQRKQLSLLVNASKLVSSSGLLFYSTCSLEVEENEDVCDQFLSHGSTFERENPSVPSHFLTDSGYARTWPHREGMDGFFVAAFRRCR